MRRTRDAPLSTRGGKRKPAAFSLRPLPGAQRSSPASATGRSSGVDPVVLRGGNGTELLGETRAAALHRSVAWA